MDSRILIVVLGLFALGAALIAALQRLAGPERAPERLWRLFGLQVAIVAAVLLPAYLGGAVWLALLVLLGLRAQYELIELEGVAPTSPPALAALALGAAAVLAAGLAGPASAALVVGLGFAWLVWASRAAALSLLFPAAAIAHLALFGRLADGFAWLALVYILVEVNDTAAYLFGRAFGSRRVLPRLSPNKTWTGLMAGLAAALLAALALNAYVFALAWGQAALIALVTVAGGLAGDLYTSALKRRAGRKDFAPVLAAHGGVLDIYDSLLFAAPCLLALLHWLPA